MELPSYAHLTLRTDNLVCLSGRTFEMLDWLFLVSDRHQTDEMSDEGILLLVTLLEATLLHGCFPRF